MANNHIITPSHAIGMLEVTKAVVIYRLGVRPLLNSDPVFILKPTPAMLQQANVRHLLELRISGIDAFIRKHHEQADEY